jgi:hypothetical protein
MLMMMIIINVILVKIAIIKTTFIGFKLVSRSFS